MELPSEVPVMTLPNAILFPQALLPLYIFEPRYRRMLTDALNSHRMFSVAMQRPGSSQERPHSIAGLGLIRASVENKDGTSNLILQGIARVRLRQTLRYKPYRVQNIELIHAHPATDEAIPNLVDRVVQVVSDRLSRNFDLPIQLIKQSPKDNPESGEEPMSARALREAVRQLAASGDPEQLVDLVSCALLPGPLERQVILETVAVEERLRKLLLFLGREGRSRRSKS